MRDSSVRIRLAWQQLDRYTLSVSPTKGFVVSSHNVFSSPDHVPAPDESSIPELEVDETIAPRPEEEIADALRATPDVEDHSQHSG